MGQGVELRNLSLQGSRVDRASFGVLSAREEQVIGLASAGLLDKQICNELGVSLNTLRTYWTRIRSKVGEAPRIALAVAYVDYATKKSNLEDDGPDWEVDLVRRTWQRTSTRPLPIESELGSELPLEEILDYFHPADRIRVMEMLGKIENDDTAAFNYTARVVTPEGPSEASAFVRVVRDETGKAIRLLGRRVTHHDLKPTSIESIAVGYWTRDLRTGEFTGDAGFRAIFGIDPNEAELREAVFSRFHPDELTHTRSFVADTVRSGKGHARSTHRLLAKDGWRWVTTDLRIEYDDGVPVRALGTVMGFN